MPFSFDHTGTTIVCCIQLRNFLGETMCCLHCHSLTVNKRDFTQQSYEVLSVICHYQLRCKELPYVTSALPKANASFHRISIMQHFCTVRQGKIVKQGVAYTYNDTLPLLSCLSCKQQVYQCHLLFSFDSLGGTGK